MPTPKKTTTTQPPKGFQKVDLQVDNYPAFEWGEDNVLTGTVIKVKTVTITDKKTGEQKDRQLAVVETEKGRFLMWESAGLEELFEQGIDGRGIWVKPTGEMELSGNRTMRLFEAYVA